MHNFVKRCEILLLTSHMLYSLESSILHSVGSNSGHEVNSPLDEIVVINIPTVARISGDESPTADRHSDLMNCITFGDNSW